MCTMCLVASEVRRGGQILWNWSCWSSLGIVWVLGIELGSSKSSKYSKPVNHLSSTKICILAQFFLLFSVSCSTCFHLDFFLPFSFSCAYRLSAPDDCGGRHYHTLIPISVAACLCTHPPCLSVTFSRCPCSLSDGSSIKRRN